MKTIPWCHIHGGFCIAISVVFIRDASSLDGWWGFLSFYRDLFLFWGEYYFYSSG